MAVSVVITFANPPGTTVTAISPVTFRVRNNQFWLFPDPNGGADTVVKIVETYPALTGSQALDVNLVKETSTSPAVFISRMDVSTSGNADGGVAWTNKTDGTALMRFTPGSVTGAGQDWMPNPTAPPAVTIKIRRQ